MRRGNGKNLALWAKRTKFHSLNVYGTKAFVNHTERAEIYSGDHPKNKTFDKAAYPGFEKGDLLPEFVSCILKNKEPIVSGKDIFRVMDVCFSIIESYKKRKTIKISYLL